MFINRNCDFLQKMKFKKTISLKFIVKNMIQAEIVHFIRLSSTKQLKKANWDADDRTSAEPFYLLLQ